MTINMKAKKLPSAPATLLNIVTNGEKLSKTLRLFIECKRFTKMQMTMLTTLVNARCS